MADDGGSNFFQTIGRLDIERRGKGLPPVERWNPEHCGDIGMRIDRSGQWWHAGSPIGRAKLVRLFSTVLRRDADGLHYLVTPVEKIVVAVEDAPFIAVAADFKGAGADQTITFRTNVDDETQAGPERPIRVEIDSETGEPAPYVLVRGRLWAKINRPTFYALVDKGVEAELDGARAFGVWSGGRFFRFADADQIRVG